MCEIRLDAQPASLEDALAVAGKVRPREVKGLTRPKARKK